MAAYQIAVVLHPRFLPFCRRLQKKETVPIPTISSSPAEPVPSPVSPVLSLQKRTHIHSIGRSGSAPPLPIGSEKQYFVPVWQVSHPEHVDLSDSKIVVTVFLSESQHFRGREMKTKPSRQTTHVRVHAGPHARRTYPGIALIDAGSPQSFVSCSFLEKMVAAGAASLSGVQHVPERNCSGFNGTPLSTGKITRLNSSVLLRFGSTQHN